ncbi:MAG: SDR family oxidoreductase [Actinomycetota bacterium]|nr:SDR family oxidoreductase [Actinomycetota bacterium]
MAHSPVALVTGASRGLGLALARDLVEAGWSLVVDARDPTPLAAAADELHERARRVGLDAAVVAIAGDVADDAHRMVLMGAVDELGGLDALVHNAGILGPSPQPGLAHYPLDVLAHVYAVNVMAPLALTQLALPRLRPGACVVAVTSDAAVEAYPGWGGYGSSKAALEQLTAVLAVEHPELRVYRVDPGDMRTRMQAEAFPGEDLSDRRPPEASVPGLRALLHGALPSGRYSARDLVAAQP